MAMDIPFKILEIHVSSAQYLPPVSKMLRTFAVAWINPDHKLSTRIDHHGHTNPTWNYKFVFRVEDRFLRSDRAALTFEIYNVAWLRDLPVGTAHLMINQISPPLVLNSPAIRTVSLNICRPSGHMQGILNIGVNILDNGGSPSCTILSPSELRIGKNEDEHDDDDYKANINNGRNDEKRSSTIDEKIKLLQDEFNKAKEKSEKFSLLPDSNDNNDNNHSDLKLQRKPTVHSSAGSTPASLMKPLPSEVAAKLKKGIYSTATGDEYGSSIFDNWSEDTDPKKLALLRPRNLMWRTIHDEESNEKQINQKRRSRTDRGKSSKGGGRGGLFSCFGKGFEFTMICGGGSRRTRNTKRKIKNGIHYPAGMTTKSYHLSYLEDDLRRFYT